MARRRRAEKRELTADPVYDSKVVAKFVNTLMKEGKKSVAEKILYGALQEISRRLKNAEPLDVFSKAIENVSPIVEVKARRVGGSTYQIPINVRPERRLSLAMRWLIDFAGMRNGKSMMDRLSAEIIDAVEGRGGAFKKKEDIHRMAQANKAFAHFNKDKDSFDKDEERGI